MKKAVVIFLIFMLTVSGISAFASTISIKTKATGVTISSPTEVQLGEDIKFSYELETEEYSVDRAFAKINCASAINRNASEGVSTSSTFYAKKSETSTSFRCDIVEDTDSPMAGVLPYKHVITKTKSTTRNTWRNYPISSIVSSKPTTISIGFWLKDSSIEKVFHNVPFSFWLFYTSDYTVAPEIPVSELINNVGVYRDGTFEGVSSKIDNAMKSYTAKTACLHRDNGWSYFVYNLENIEYADSFNPTYTYFYEWFNEAYNNLIAEGKPAIEISNFTFLTNDKIKNGYIIYSGINDTSHKYVLSKTSKELIIPGELVTADIEIDITANDNIPPRFLGVEDGQTYTEPVTPLCDDKDATVILTRNNVTQKYTIGTPISEAGVYTLTAEDERNRVTIIKFKIKDKDYVDVTKNATGCTITGDDKAQQYEEYTFTVNVKEGAKGISLGYVEYEDGGKKTYALDSGKTEFTLPDYIVTGDFEIYVWASECVGNTTIEESSEFYDKNAVANLQCISVKLNLNGNTVFKVLLDGKEVSYEVSDNIYTVTNSFLNDLSLGTHSIEFVTDYGDYPSALFTVIDTNSTELPMQCKVKDNEFIVRMRYNDTEDLTHRFSGLTAIDHDKNIPINFGYSYVIPRDEADIWATGRALSGGGDECAPFNYNSSYIGANHGQSNAVLVVSPSHGKTYADIGSYWKSSDNRHWNLLKIVNEDKLLFLSDNYGSTKTKYYFLKSISGPLTYVSGGENKDSIEISSQTGSQQLYSSIRHKEKSVYAVYNGKRYLVEGNAAASCDYVDIVEKYDIMNPALVGQYLRLNRPAGGYTEPQSMAIGEPVISYDITYRLLPDGTVLSIMNHEILGDIVLDYYGGIQYQQRGNSYGGGVWRYLPETRPFTATQGNTGVQYNFDFTKPFNTTENNVPSGITLKAAQWENPNVVPDRQVDYLRDTDGKNMALFAGGYLPILDAEPQTRLKKVTSSTYIYKSKKTYPYLINGSSNGVSGTKIQAVAYKKYDYQGDDDTIGSAYTIPYGNTTYIYLDYHETGTDKYILPENLLGSKIKLVKKSSNVTYEVSDKQINITVDDRSEGYGYLVLSAENEGLLANDTEITANVSEEAVLIIAGYNGNALTEVESFTIDEPFVKSIDSLGFGKNVTEIRAFLWRNGIKPVSKSITLFDE